MTAPGKHPAEAGDIHFDLASEIEEKPIEWLYPGWFPKGKFMMLSGEGGLGKSTFYTDIAARITIGHSYPTGDGKFTAGSVALFSAEEGAADTVTPRLRIAGADLAKVHIFKAVGSGDDRRGLDVSVDLSGLRERLKAIEDLQLVVFDPLYSYTGPANVNATDEVRQITNQLTDFAEETGVAVLTVTHLNKNEDASPKNRSVGSHAWPAACRLELRLDVHPDDAARRVVVRAKNNYGTDHGGLVFQFVDHDGEQHAGVEWDREIWDGGLSDLGRNRNGSRSTGGRTSDAAEWLLSRPDLDGESPGQILAEAEAEGHAANTIREAARRIGIKLGRGRGSKWKWPREATVDPGDVQEEC